MRTIIAEEILHARIDDDATCKVRDIFNDELQFTADSGMMEMNFWNFIADMEMMPS